jgi:hypothetical protein
MRAQEDSGIREELKTFGINKEMFYREKEIAAISMATSMLWLVGTAKEKKMLACLQSVVDDVVAYGRKQHKAKVLVISLIKEA